MEDFNTLSFCELRAKEVVNVSDGRRLGRVIDVVICLEQGRGEVQGLLIPYTKRFFFSRAQEVFVPLTCIRKIGEDVILADLIFDTPPPSRGRDKHRRYDYGEAFQHGAKAFVASADTKKEEDGDGSAPDPAARDKRPKFSITNSAPLKKEREYGDEIKTPSCDKKCEKCMLFDCGERWRA
jgi:YlmC/YmxH family sporulation protein